MSFLSPNTVLPPAEARESSAQSRRANVEGKRWLVLHPKDAELFYQESGVMKSRLAVAAVAFAIVGLCSAHPPVVTFSNDDAARAIAIACQQDTYSRAPVHVHRNVPGNMVYCVSEDHREGVLYSESNLCHELTSETLNVWRNEEGDVAALLIQRTEGRLLMIGEAELRGKRFDVERTGTYFIVSQGKFTQLSARVKPYRVLHVFENFDGKRIFARKGDLVIVGDNLLTNQLEARFVQIRDEQIVELPPQPVANMPAGVRVLDFAESTNDLLLGGVDPQGQTLFVVVNLATGESSAITPKKQGDDQAMFLGDGNIRAKLSGTSGAAGSKRNRSGEDRRDGAKLPFKLF